MERWMERSRKRGREGEEGRKEEREGERTSSVKCTFLRTWRSPESRNPESWNLEFPESRNPINLSDSVFLKDLHDRFSDRFGPEGVAVVGRMDAVD